MTILNALAAGALGGLALVAAALPASAGGDVIYTGVKGMRGTDVAVPVPAPVPIPETSSGFYLRFDAAYSQNSIERYSDTDPRFDAARADSGLANFGRYGFGAGYHFSRWFRSDVTLDTRSEVRSKGNSSVNYDGVVDAGGHAIQMNDQTFDRFRTTNYTAMLNGYVDIPVTERLTPYVGAGVGVVLHTTQGRQLQKITTCVDPLNCDPAGAGTLLNPNNPGYTGLNANAFGSGGTNKSTGLAWAVMAGTSYRFTQFTSLDVGYRMLHLDGTTFTAPWNGSNATRLTIPDQYNHEIRIGIRYDIN